MALGSDGPRWTHFAGLLVIRALDDQAPHGYRTQILRHRGPRFSLRNNMIKLAFRFAAFCVVFSPTRLISISLWMQ